MIRTDAASQRRLDAARRAFRGLPKDLKNTIRRQQRAEMGPVWKAEMAAALAKAPALGTRQAIFRSGTKVKAGLPMYLVAGASTRRLSGGGTPMALDTAYEFGKYKRNEKKTYTRRSRKGRAHSVTRRTSRQLPPRNKTGWVVYPAISQTIPKFMGSVSRAVTERIYDAIDGKG